MFSKSQGIATGLETGLSDNYYNKSNVLNLTNNNNKFLNTLNELHLKSTTNSRESLNKQIEDAKVQLTKFRDSLINELVKNNVVIRENQSLDNKIEELREERTELTNEKNDLTTQLETQQGKVDELSDLINNEKTGYKKKLNDEIEKVTNLTNQLKGELQSDGTRSGGIIKELETKTNEVTTLSTNLVNTKKELNEKKDKLKTLQKKEQELTSQNLTQAGIIKGLEDDIDDLSKNLENTTKELNEKEEERDRLDKLVNGDDDEDPNSEKGKGLIKLLDDEKEKVIKLNNDINYLNGEIKTKESLIEELKEKEKANKIIIQQKDDEISILEDINDNQGKEIKKLNNTVASLNEEINNLDVEIDDLTVALYEANKIISVNKKQLSNLQENNYIGRLIYSIQLLGLGYNNDLKINIIKNNIITVFATTVKRIDNLYWLQDYKENTEKNQNNLLTFKSLTQIKNLVNNQSIWIPQMNDIISIYPELIMDKIYVEAPINCTLVIFVKKIHKISNVEQIIEHIIPKSNDIINTLRNNNGSGLDGYIRSLPVENNGGCGGLYWISNRNGKYYANNKSNYDYIYALYTIKDNVSSIQGSLFIERFFSNKEPGIDLNLYEYGYLYTSDQNNYEIIKTKDNIPIYNTLLEFYNLDTNFIIKIIKSNTFNVELSDGNYRLKIINYNGPDIKNINDDGTYNYDYDGIWYGDKLTPYFGYEDKLIYFSIEKNNIYIDNYDLTEKISLNDIDIEYSNTITNKENIKNYLDLLDTDTGNSFTFKNNIDNIETIENEKYNWILFDLKKIRAIKSIIIQRQKTDETISYPKFISVKLNENNYNWNSVDFESIYKLNAIYDSTKKMSINLNDSIQTECFFKNIQNKRYIKIFININEWENNSSLKIGIKCFGIKKK